MRATIILTFTALSLTGGLSAQQPRDTPHAEQTLPGARDYYAPLTSQEKGDISFLIKTLAYKSSFGLLMQRSALSRAGNRTAHIHPLRFFGYVFSDPQLKKAVKRINGTAWRRFVEGMAGSFASAERRNNMKQAYVDDFAKQVDVPVSIIEPFVKQHQWKRLINTVRSRV